MVTADEFRTAFADDGLVLFPESAVSSLSIDPQDAEWLISVGLPDSAAPFLSFGTEYEINIPTLTELWGIADGSQYRIIGSNGSGDPVAIDTATSGHVVYLNHDNNFQRVFINSSIMQLACCLLACKRLIKEAQVVNGPEAYLDGNVPADVRARFISTIESSDPPAIVDGMWADELAQLDGRAAES
jgi:hypothetical protein